MKVIFEDEFILILDKPSGITVNRSETTLNEKTVQDFVEEKFKIPDEYKDSDFYKRSGIVHRIDKETSGILLVGKTKEAFEDLQKQFKERTVEKAYIALVHGKVVPQEGEIISPVGRLPWNRKRFGVLAGGREALTTYKVLEVKYLQKDRGEEALSILEVKPKTGRTHQIRVHLKSFGHPVFSDVLYGGRKTSRDDRRFLGRLFLHAAKIEFMHPISGKKVSYRSEISQDLKDFLGQLK